MKITVAPSLSEFVNSSDEKTKKLFKKQKEFMSLDPFYPSLGRTKLKNVVDKYNNPLWEVRLDKKRRIIYVEKDDTEIIWLRICSHDELKRNDKIIIRDCYGENTE